MQYCKSGMEGKLMTETTSENGIQLLDAAIQLHPKDQVAIVKQEIMAGTDLRDDRPGAETSDVLVRQSIPAGHKIALKKIPAGAEVLRYGHKIGVASQVIEPGDWVHSHNLVVGDMSRDFNIRVSQSSGNRASIEPVRTFSGFRRPDGRAGTRNFIIVISTVSCSAQTAQAIADHFTPELLAAYPHVDGVLAITHYSGCTMPPGSLAYQYLERMLLNLARHPNVGAVLYVSLGCEVMQIAPVLQAAHLDIPVLTIQELGGIQKTTAAGIRLVESLLPTVNACHRTPVPMSKLTIALQCGGSDGWSGVTANPLVGLVADQVVAAGGTVVLAETPEIYGAEDLLTMRVVSQQVGEKLVERIRWWQSQAALLGFSLDNNPTPGNKAGGLTTIFEKSLGAIAKGGSTPLMAVYEYAELIDSNGLVFMDTPGYDPAAVSGQVAGGSNLVLFTTGRGSVFGGGLAPCIKIASNSRTFTNMSADMDFNAGDILDGVSMAVCRDRLLELLLQIASGESSRSEQKISRQMEFIPWQPGAML
jgi:altronate hydrolase